MKLTVKLVEELNSCYGSDLISFSVEKGATLFYKGLLKSFIEKHSISDSEGISKSLSVLFGRNEGSLRCYRWLE